MGSRPMPSGREAIEEGRQEWKAQVLDQYSSPSDDDSRLADDEEMAWWEEELDIGPEFYFGNGASTYNGNPLYEDGNARDENGNVLGITVTGKERGMRIRRLN